MELVVLESLFVNVAVEVDYAMLFLSAIISRHFPGLTMFLCGAFVFDFASHLLFRQWLLGLDRIKELNHIV